MDIRVVFYEKYKGTVTSEFHYIPWAISKIEQDCESDALYMLAGLQKPYNIFEVEEYFYRAVEDLRIPIPSYKQCVAYKTYEHLSRMEIQPEGAISEAMDIATMAFEEDDEEYLWNWISVSQSIDEYHFESKGTAEDKKKLLKEILEVAEESKELLLKNGSSLTSYKDC